MIFVPLLSLIYVRRVACAHSCAGMGRCRCYSFLAWLFSVVFQHNDMNFWTRANRMCISICSKFLSQRHISLLFVHIYWILCWIGRVITQNRGLEGEHFVLEEYYIFLVCILLGFQVYKVFATVRYYTSWL